MRKSLIFVGFLSFFLALIFSKNTFAEDKTIYISRVYATDTKEFVEVFNSGEDYKFQEISLKNNQKQVEIAGVQNGIFKSQEYMTFAQNAQNSDVKFKEEFRNIDTIGQQPILGLYVDGKLKDYICSDEKRCIKGFSKNSTDLKPSNKGVEKIAVSKAEILKNGGKMTSTEVRNNYDFGLRNLEDYSPKFGGIKLDSAENQENLNKKNEELQQNSKVEEKSEKNLDLKDEKDPKNDKNEVFEKEIIDENQKPAENLENPKLKEDLAEKQDSQTQKPEFKPENQKISKENKAGFEFRNQILAPNTGFSKATNESFGLKLLFLAIFEILILTKRRFLNEDF